MEFEIKICFLIKIQEKTYKLRFGRKLGRFCINIVEYMLDIILKTFEFEQY